MRPNITGAQLGGVTNLAVLAPIKPGFVEGFETITYVERLRRLLAALNAARLAAREASLTKPVFPDSIGRFGIIHSFRYAIVPPGKESSSDTTAALMNPGTSRLSLNVTFDGGWEPYMRVIYRDIGTLLDALFCNCGDLDPQSVDHYPGSGGGFDKYCRWVRKHELDRGLFYTDSTLSLGDQRYLERIERIQREERDPAAADRAIAGFAVESAREQRLRTLRDAKLDPIPAVASALRSIKGFFRLSPYFPPNKNNEHLILIRFAQNVLSEFRELDQGGLLDSAPPFQAMAKALREELVWFRTEQRKPPAEDRLTFEPARLQAGIVNQTPGITHGCMVLLRVEKGAADQAGAFLARFPVSREGMSGGDAIQRSVGLTWQGLRELGVPAERLDKLPPEFAEGMEARAGLLGDLRSNHPDHWSRPRRNWPVGRVPAGEPIDLSTVHVVITLRLAGDAEDNAVLHPAFGPVIDALQDKKAGLTVLSVQPLRSYREGKSTSREHFGFLDGFSQPRASVADANKRAGDDVKVGELLLGYCNERGDAPSPNEKADDLLDDGTFLVVRKLRQHVDVLTAVLDEQTRQLAPNPDAARLMKELLLEKMMGRRKDGTSLAATQGPPGANQFDYAGDPQGAQCPFHSHVRRANPRDGRPYLPRILRRGMSYGPRVTGPAEINADRGIVFMAFCASIAEQFEVVQRWIAGGNSSGVSSSQADPFLAVPERGEKRTFRFRQEDGKVVRVDLGERPFVSLEWGMYLFVPSLAALQNLPRIVAYRPEVKPEPQETPSRAPSKSLSRETWRGLLEDPDPARVDAGWKLVRAQQGGVLATKYGLLVGEAKSVLQVLQDDGRQFSVSGYGERMAQSIGLGYLGLDPGNGHTEQAEHSPKSVNQAIEAIGQEQAFNAARPIVTGVLAAFKGFARPGPGGTTQVPVDLLTLSENVLARLCTVWFGLPDPAPADKPLMVIGGRRSDVDATPARCPGHLLATSRHIFSPQPSDAVRDDAKKQGDAVLQAFKALLAGGGRLGQLAQDIKERLQHIPSVQSGDAEFLVARTIAGVMLGFPPTVYGNFLRTLDNWLTTGALWDLQQRLAERKTELPDEFKRAQTVLLDPLIATMRKRPIPEVIWRTACEGAVLNGEPVPAKTQVILGLASAVSDTTTADDSLMFGGHRDPENPNKTVHACPGRGMAIGVLLALLSGLLEAGELRPAGSRIQLTLIPPAS